MNVYEHFYVCASPYNPFFSPHGKEVFQLGSEIQGKSVLISLMHTYKLEYIRIVNHKSDSFKLLILRHFHSL